MVIATDASYFWNPLHLLHDHLDHFLESTAIINELKTLTAFLSDGSLG